jgi:uncharacterized protein
MRWLIDGYNLMHAQGVLTGKVVGRDTFRRLRRWFLNDLADALGAERALETTVVFDASAPPADFTLESVHKGLTVVFALEDENADARIERLVAQHSAPKSLTVVSSDRRIRQAATRRRAKSLTADEFLDLIERLKRRKRVENLQETVPKTPSLDRESPLTAEESAYWLDTFRDLDSVPETRAVFAPDSSLLTDEEIAQLQREIDREP